MRRINGGWWAFILALVVLFAPVRAHADWFSWMGGGGGSGTDPSGDPDAPGPGDDRISPNTRVIGNGGPGVHRTPSSPIQRVRVNRYLTLLSGLRSYYLHF